MRACSKEPGDLLGDRIEVDVVETGSGWQAGHGAHLGKQTHTSFHWAVIRSVVQIICTFHSGK